MSEEEKEAIEKLDYELTYSWVHNQGISKETLKLFKDIIEKQQKEIENLKEKLKYERSFSSSALEALKEGVHKDEIRHIRDKAECMDYYSLNDVIDDLTKLIGE